MLSLLCSKLPTNTVYENKYVIKRIMIRIIYTEEANLHYILHVIYFYSGYAVIIGLVG